MDKLDAHEGPLSRRRARGRDGRLLPHATFNLNPRAASIDTPLHAFLPYRHVDHVHPDAVIAIAASKNSRAADQGDLRRRDRLAAVEAAGLRARPVAGEIRAREPGGEGLRARKPRPLHLGRRRQGLLRADARHHQPRHRLVRARDGRQGGLRRRGRRSRCRAERRRAIAAQADAGDPRPASARTSRRSGISTIPPRCWNSSARSACDELAALGTSCPDHFLRTKIWPLVLDLDAAAAISTR